MSDRDRTEPGARGDPPTTGRLLALAILGWLAVLAVDFFVHGGALARLYFVEDDPFLLPPGRAFALIPVGYAGYALLTVLLVWLMVRLGERGARQGAVFGFVLGALVWGAFGLGLLSISTARPLLVAGWFVGETAAMAAAGAVIGAGLAGGRLWRIAVVVIGGLLALAALTIVLQNLGWAPAIKTGAGGPR